jgi:hypothetical protein
MAFTIGYMIGVWGIYAILALIFKHKIAIILTSIICLFMGISLIVAKNSVWELIVSLCGCLIIYFSPKIQINSKAKELCKEKEDYNEKENENYNEIENEDYNKNEEISTTIIPAKNNKNNSVKTNKKRTTSNKNTSSRRTSNKKIKVKENSNNNIDFTKDDKKTNKK